MNFIINKPFFETSNVNKVRSFKKSTPLVNERNFSKKCFPIYIFPRITVPDTVTKPLIKLCSLFLKKCFRFNYQPIFQILNQSCLKNFSHLFTEQELLRFLIKTENVHPKFYNLLQTNTESFSETEISPNVITQAITAQISIQVRSIQSTLTEKSNAQTSNQNTSFGFQPQTESTSVNINPNKNNTENTDSIFPTEITGVSIPASSALIPGITIPLHHKNHSKQFR